MESTTLTILTLSGAILLGAMSPGQSFILVARTAVASSRKAAMGTALGMGVGCLIFAALALLGFHSILTWVPWLYSLLKTAGGLYLIWLAIKMFRKAGTPLAVDASDSTEMNFRQAFITGLLTQLSNPNTAIVFGSIFAAILSHKITLFMYLALPAIAFLIDLLWYGFVAYVLSASRPRQVYLSYKASLDRMSGCVMGLLGFRLIVR
ncbi:MULTISPECIES: LysE family transporter [unclassified Brenneria]|uniref:LysE family translocator n=1 Tax=unclassified Brenneria TaxID=2634434 RepID=UPI0029C38024|nr:MULTISPECIES: LysE family transporter [unclassified Brenneria]MDX5627342.1 LysE family transporter [Brenneria sp. L3-3Z]MDX5694502.1 LysE family transporter [Brenneria sp. L4-2C]MEE3661874.1 LysE family transporter [Brenneria sp. g21c3]